MKTIHCLLIPLVVCGPLRADFSNNQPASSVIGKPDFTSSTPTTASAENLAVPVGLAIDPTTGKVFVSQEPHNRILRFSSVAAYQNGAAAESVLGQISFTGSTANQGGTAAANTLNSPEGIACDAAGRLWVADLLNHRVLRYDGASAKAIGAAADGVLGQPNFTSTSAATSDSGMNRPIAVCTDSAGNLWVAELNNNRVLRFATAASRANGAPANQVLGQSTFTTSAAALGAGGMSKPNGLFVDSSQRLWVACQNQNRVLRFNNAASKGNGGNADGVFGQADFNSSVNTPISAASLYNPVACTVTTDGTLWVSDGANRRVLGYKGAAGKPSGASADLVLGQAGFETGDLFPVSARTFAYPHGLAVGRDGVLLVVDVHYHRVLRFSPTVEITAPARVTARNGRAKIRGTSAFASRVEAKAPTGPFRGAIGTANWTVNLSGLTRPTTRVPVKASAFDGRSAQSTVVVKRR